MIPRYAVQKHAAFPVAFAREGDYVKYEDAKALVDAIKIVIGHLEQAAKHARCCQSGGEGPLIVAANRLKDAINNF